MHNHEFIGLANLLKPNDVRYWAEQMPILRQSFAEATEAEREDFKRKANAMPYDDYLRSRYWAIVRGFKTKIQKWCEFCRGRYALSVHHTSYDVRGVEHQHLSSLRVYCRDCHAYQHGKQTPQQFKGLWERRLNAGRNRAFEPESAPVDGTEIKSAGVLL